MLEYPDVCYQEILDAVGVCVMDATDLVHFIGRPFTQLENTNVRKVNVSTFYVFGRSIHDLRKLQPGDSFVSDCETFRIILAVKISITLFFDTETQDIGFPHTRDTLTRFRDFLESNTAQGEEDQGSLNPDGVITEQFIEVLGQWIQSFETFFHRESVTANIFAVTKKGIYELTSLIENASNALPAKVVGRLSDDAKNNINAAGRCLALDSPTACGFHILRAVESLMRDYHFQLANTALKPQQRNWGKFIELLEKHGADVKVTGYLKHIKDHYRNPLIHPEDNLDSDEALSLFNASLSAITMLDTAMNP